METATTTRVLRVRWLCLAGLALVLPSCGWDGNFQVLGYSTKPNYDEGIRTVRIPIFKNRTFEQGLEYEMTRALIREIPANSPYRVVDANSPADTELIGEIVQFDKTSLLFNPFFHNRQVQNTLTVTLQWRDLRTGKYLTARARQDNNSFFDSEAIFGSNTILGDNIPVAPTQPGSPGLDVAPPPQDDPNEPPPSPIVLRAVTEYSEELGQSRTSGRQASVDKMAVMIRRMMESPW